MLAGMRLAVLTGDIVDSSSLRPDRLDAGMDALQGAARHVGRWPGVGEIGFARRGGDGWQMAMGHPTLALRAALYLRASLRRLDKQLATRIALADGEGTIPDDLNSAHGPAFTASGRHLDRLGSHVLMSHAASGALDAAAILADHISQGWTQAQARALCELLPPEAGTRAEAAERLGISRQAVDQAAWAAGLPALAEALERLEGAER